MSVPSNQIDLPQSTGRTWMMLVASSAALVVLFAWALRNPHTLFKTNPVSAQIAITDQSESDLQLAGNTALQSESNADASEIELNLDEATEQNATLEPAPVTENPQSAASETEQLAVVNVDSDQPPSSVKPIEGDGEQQEAEQLAINQDTDKNDQDKVQTVKVADDSASTENPGAIEQDERQLAAQRLAAAESDQLLTESTFAEKLAKEKEAVDKALADKLAAEQAAAEKKLIDEKREAERAVAQKLSEQRAAEEKAAADKIAEEKAAAAEKEAEAKIAQEQAEAEKVAAQTAADESNAGAANLETEQLAALPLATTGDGVNQAVSENETAFETSRREDLAKLPELATQIRFATNDTETTGDSKQLLDRMFELLFLYSETTVSVQVATNEYEVDDTNQLLSRLRSLVIINYLVKRGLDEGRFKVRALGQEGLPFNSHEVSVEATVIDNGDK